MAFFTDNTGALPDFNSLKRAYPFDTSDQGPALSPLPNIPLISDQDAIETWGFENTCFGSIIDVKVSPTNVDKLNEWTAWQLIPQQSFFVVQDGDFLTLKFLEVKFGRLNKGLCKALRDLVAQSQVHIQAFIPSDNLVTAMQSRNGRTPEHLPAEINIYGPKANAREIGGILSKSGIFLQMPQYGLETAEYYNPQILRMEGYPDILQLDESQESTNGAHETDTHEAPGRSQRDPTRRNDTEMVESILDSLSHHPMLQEIATVPDIRTPLLDHQKEAIDFVYRRETEQMGTDLSLWKYNDVDADEPFYQHVLSGAKQPKRAEAKGGIIADEMGLGKSLVIISTIAGSLDRAKAFVAAENEQRLSQPGRRAASEATLIIVPSSLLIDNWVDEVRKHTFSGSLSFHKHIGSGRHKETQYLCDRPIIFTTYATVAAEFRRGDSILAKINWFRIVLDEAHDIRNRSTKQFQAVVNLPALHRWCLTGTPIQNTLDDLGALVSFLKVPILEKAPTFRKLITNPINSDSRYRFKNLQALLRTVCLRRTRELLNLPEPKSEERKLPLSPSELRDYRDLLIQGRLEIDMAVSQRGKTNVKSAFLESLLKLRLFCNNGRTNAMMHCGPTGLPTDPTEALGYLEQHDQNICAYCSGVVYFISENAGSDGGTFISGCSHLICHNCFQLYRKEPCPTCAGQHGLASETTLPSSEMHIEALSNDEDTETGRTVPYPSKLLALLSDVRQNSTHKSIVFSSWKKTLGLVSRLFTSHGIRHKTIDGSLPSGERIKVLKDFRSSNGANILLMTLGTGAVGLNLAVASRIYLLEPQWNPSIESQAIGRALRIGQTAQVVIIRYIMEDTIEENVFGVNESVAS
ncbi:P-loop containing nucleoside triphosphate hydrolase [Apiospora kogelbergensis]|uniref:P-loop containing nucleoside triphosphate hydrolase n=1 Tax=Apiospora kogelbergensis TaxID=1337665 RepID=A0AAW0RE48_9PEZI